MTTIDCDLRTTTTTDCNFQTTTIITYDPEVLGHDDDVPYCDYESAAVQQVACRRGKDGGREYLRCSKIDGGCGYFSWVEEEETELTDLKFQLCGLQRTLMSRLDVMEEMLGVEKVLGTLRKNIERIEPRVQRIEYGVFLSVFLLVIQLLKMIM